jgi:ribosome-associated protein
MSTGGRILLGSSLINTTLLDRASPAVELDGRELALLVARIADDYRGQDTIVLDLRKVTPIMDYFVITTANSARQMKGMAEEVNRAVKAHGQRRLGIEGLDGNTWVLEDFGDVVLHIFNADARKLYDLEHLWSDAVRVDWKEALNT